MKANMKTRMKRAFAAGLSFTLLTAPLAMAQDAQHGAPAHGAPAGHAGPAAHAAAPRRAAAPAHAAAAPRPTRAAPHAAARAAPRTAAHSAAAPASHGMSENRGASAGRAPVAAGGGHNWRAGGRYTGGRHVVDYNRYHLRQPPAGYEWVQDGNQFVLIAITSGIIASVLAANGY